MDPGGLAQCAIHGYISYNGYGGDDDAGDDDAGDDGDSKGCSHTASLSLVRCIFVSLYLCILVCLYLCMSFCLRRHVDSKV